jgi:hypothetical protein
MLQIIAELKRFFVSGYLEVQVKDMPQWEIR